MVTYSYVNWLLVNTNVPYGAYPLAVGGDAYIDGIVCACCFCGPGAGGGGLWADTTNPYICPCNSCGVCIGTKLKIPVGTNCY